MEERRKNAYRWLFYLAMLDIRQLAWMDWNWLTVWRPFYRKQQNRRVQFAGDIADWLHNLAMFSSLDFIHFDEEWFWREFDSLRGRYPEFALERYRNAFNEKAGAPPPGR